MRKGTSMGRIVALAFLTAITLGPMGYTFINCFSCDGFYGLIPAK